MNKIVPIDLHSLDNKDHFLFMTRFNELIAACPSAVMGSEVTYGIFKNTLMAESLAIRIEEGSSAAQSLDRLDKLRDKTWYALVMRIQATLQSPVKGEADSAKIIYNLIKPYGDICSLTYSEQSAAIEKLTNDLQLLDIANYTDNIGISEWIQELKIQNNEFTEVFNAINSEFAGRESTDVKAVRTLIDPVYLQLVERINAAIILEFALPEVLVFAQKLNEIIKSHRTPLTNRERDGKVAEKKVV